MARPRSMRRSTALIAASTFVVATLAGIPPASAATMTVSFNDHPIRFEHLNWQMKTVHSVGTGGVVTGFRYEAGTGNGQRTDKHGVTWPTSAVYDAVLGAGGAAKVNSWPMKAVVLYATQKNGDWRTSGWNPYQDMAEGAAAVDDSARTAVALATDYLRNGTAGSLSSAKALLAFTSYLTTVEGKVYNFAWLDAPAMFAWNPVQAQDKHFMYRSEFYRRTQYPPLGPNGSKAAWHDFEADPTHIVRDSAGNKVLADPFISHPKYSIAMDDLQATNGADVAPVYNGPLYTTATGAPSGYLTGIKKDWTTSTLNLGADDARQLWALAVGLQMMQKVKSQSGGVFTSDDLAFAKFLENQLYRVVRNVAQYDLTTLDSRLAANLLVGLSEYYRAVYSTTPYGNYVPLLPQSGTSSGGTTSPYDDPLPQSTLYQNIDEAQLAVSNRQLKTGDWRDGIFIDDAAGGNWQAWGQLQIYALSKAYRLKRDIGQTPTQLDSLLNTITYSADRFYGNQAYHYRDSSNNYARTKERITSITGWAAKFHTNEAQSVYQDSSMVAGLIELAEAYYQSNRADATTKRAEYLEYARRVGSWFIGNNTALLPMYTGKTSTYAYEGRGAVLDEILPNGSGVGIRKGDAGGESSAEGLWAMVLIKDAIVDYGLSATFSFNY